MEIIVSETGLDLETIGRQKKENWEWSSRQNHPKGHSQQWKTDSIIIPIKVTWGREKGVEDSLGFFFLHGSIWKVLAPKFFSKPFLFKCAKIDWQLQMRSRWVSESWQLLGARLLDGGRKGESKPSLLKRHFHANVPHCPLQTVCFVLPVQDSGWFSSPYNTPPWNIYMFGYIDKENETKQNKTKKDAHTKHTQHKMGLCSFVLRLP